MLIPHVRKIPIDTNVEHLVSLQERWFTYSFRAFLHYCGRIRIMYIVYMSNPALLQKVGNKGRRTRHEFASQTHRPSSTSLFLNLHTCHLVSMS